MPIYLSTDTETFSNVSVKIVGGSKYSRHESTELLMLSPRINEGSGWKELPQWVPAEGQKVPKDLLDLLRDPEVIKTGWNIGGFEYYIYKELLGIDIPAEDMRDTMVLAYSLSLPGSLGKCGEVLGLESDKKKDARGKKLIGLFCEPHLPTKKISAVRYDWRTHPAEWEEFKGYNRQDTLAEVTIFDKLIRWDMPKHEWKYWAVDQKINRAGAPINLRQVDAAIRLARDAKTKGIRRLCKITGVDNPNSGKQLLPWLQSRGYKYEDLKKGHISRALESATPGTPLYDALKIRQEVSKSSVTKYQALKNGTDSDGMLRGMFQFAGAGRTWRWAGRRAQLQNWAKATGFLEHMQIQAAGHVENLSYQEISLMYPRPMELLSSTLRPTIKAPPGHMLVDADLNAIENRVLGWASGEKKILKVFEDGRCPYVDFATLMYDESYEKLWAEYKAGDKKRRTMAKPAVLGCFGPDTLVLTEKGYLPIIKITNGVRIHDGVEFVSHDGLLDQGVKDVIDLHGVTVTPDHKILSGGEWEPAECLVSEEKAFQSALSTANGLLSGARSTLDTRQNISSHTRSTAEVRTTSRVYDILNCGPRNRFVVLTDAGPVIVHNCGFRLSAGEIKENTKTAELEATGLIGYAWNMGVRNFTKDDAVTAVDIFRAKYKKVVSFWYDIEDAAKDCIATGRSQKCRVVEFERDGPLLRMWLPSGHALSYVRPKIEMRKTPWGAVRPTITYESLNDKNQWVRIGTHGGKLTENAVQGIARDLLAYAMCLADAKGLDLRLHVHDQLIALAPADRAQESLDLLMKCMSYQPKWARASSAWNYDLPLGSAGIITPNFIKD